jgi:hypothetical protein
MMIEWDGKHVPKELEQLPPGRYVVTDAYLEDDEMTEEEAAGVMLALDEVEAGHVIPLDEALQDIRAQAGRE